MLGEAPALVDCSLHLVAEDCMVDCHGNHLDPLDCHLGHLEEDHHLGEAVGIGGEDVAVAAGIRIGVAAGGDSKEEAQEEVEAEGSCTAERQPLQRCMKGSDAVQVL